MEAAEQYLRAGSAAFAPGDPGIRVTVAGVAVIQPDAFLRWTVYATGPGLRFAASEPAVAQNRELRTHGVGLVGVEFGA